MATSNQQIYDAMLRHQTYLIRYSAGVRNRILLQLKDSERDILDILAGLDLSAGVSTPAEWAKLEKAIARIKLKRGSAWDEASAVFKAEMLAIAKAEPKFTMLQVKKSLPVAIDMVGPTAAELALAISRPFQGRTLMQWGHKMRDDDIFRIVGVAQGAITSGNNPTQLVRAAFNTTANQVDAIARTSTTALATMARTETLRKNDEMGTEEYVAVLDDRTTLECASLNGKLFAVGYGPQPPIHFGCRSIRCLVFSDALLKDKELLPETEAQLVKEYARENDLGSISSRADLPFGYKGKFDDWAPQRVSGMIGPPVKSIPYGDWLRTQSASFQVDTLGVSRAALFRQGNLSLDKFVGRDGGALTLDQMRDRYPGAFRKSGL